MPNNKKIKRNINNEILWSSYTFVWYTMNLHMLIIYRKPVGSMHNNLYYSSFCCVSIYYGN